MCLFSLPLQQSWAFVLLSIVLGLVVVLGIILLTTALLEDFCLHPSPGSSRTVQAHRLSFLLSSLVVHGAMLGYVVVLVLITFGLVNTRRVVMGMPSPILGLMAIKWPGILWN